jgi:hypothetical protein
MPLEFSGALSGILSELLEFQASCQPRLSLSKTSARTATKARVSFSCQNRAWPRNNADS